MKSAAIAWKLAIAAVVLSSSFACGGAAQKSPPASVVVTNRATAAHVSFVETLPGRDPQLLWDDRGNLHLLTVQEIAGKKKIVYRRLGNEPAGPFDVSPTDFEVTAHGETPPAFEILRDGTLLAAYPVALPGKWKGELRVQRSTDRGATWGAPRLLHYVASKGAVISMTRSLARELGPSGIGITVVAPGILRTSSTEYVPEERHRLYEAGRAVPGPQSPEDVVGTIVFLLTPAALAVTGQVIPVNAGFAFA